MKNQKPPTDWRDTIQIAEQDPHRRNHSSDYLTRIELTESTKLIYQQPCQAWPRAREAEKAEVIRGLCEGAFEPSQAEWAYLIGAEAPQFVTLLR